MIIRAETLQLSNELLFLFFISIAAPLFCACFQPRSLYTQLKKVDDLGSEEEVMSACFVIITIFWSEILITPLFLGYIIVK
jgi:hypothetical protein